MMQIHSKPDEFPLEHIKLQIDDPDLDIATAGEMAKAKARELTIFYNPSALFKISKFCDI